MEVTAHRYRVSFWSDRNVPESDNGHGCTTLCAHQKTTEFGTLNLLGW